MKILFFSKETYCNITLCNKRAYEDFGFSAHSPEKRSLIYAEPDSPNVDYEPQKSRPPASSAIPSTHCHSCEACPCAAIGGGNPYLDPTPVAGIFFIFSPTFYVGFF